MGMPVIPPCTATQEQAVGALIESIAMEESALAHILNAESEKLMAVITARDVTPKELLAVNTSVRETMAAITQLESMLQAKLSLVRQAICR